MESKTTSPALTARAAPPKKNPPPMELNGDPNDALLAACAAENPPSTSKKQSAPPKPQTEPLKPQTEPPKPPPRLAPPAKSGLTLKEMLNKPETTNGKAPVKALGKPLGKAIAKPPAKVAPSAAAPKVAPSAAAPKVTPSAAAPKVAPPAAAPKVAPPAAAPKVAPSAPALHLNGQPLGVRLPGLGGQGSGSPLAVGGPDEEVPLWDMCSMHGPSVRRALTAEERAAPALLLPLVLWSGVDDVAPVLAVSLKKDAKSNSPFSGGRVFFCSLCPGLFSGTAKEPACLDMSIEDAQIALRYLTKWTPQHVAAAHTDLCAILWRLRQVFKNCDWSVATATDMKAAFEAKAHIKLSHLHLPHAPRHVAEDLERLPPKGVVTDDALLTKRWESWLKHGGGEHWKAPEGKPHCHPIPAHDARAEPMGSRKELTEATHRLLRSPTSVTIKALSIGNHLRTLLSNPPPVPKDDEAERRSALDAEEEEQATAAAESLLNPPKPEKKKKKRERKEGNRSAASDSKRRKHSRFVDDMCEVRGEEDGDSAEDSAEDGFVVSDHDSDVDEDALERRIKKREKGERKAQREARAQKKGAISDDDDEDDEDDDGEDDSAEYSSSEEEEEELDEDEDEGEEEEDEDEGEEEDTRDVSAAEQASGSLEDRDDDDDHFGRRTHKDKDKKKKKRRLVRLADDEEEEEEEEERPQPAALLAQQRLDDMPSVGAPKPKGTELRAPGCTASAMPPPPPRAAPPTKPVSKPPAGSFASCSPCAPGGSHASALSSPLVPGPRAHAMRERVNLRSKAQAGVEIVAALVERFPAEEDHPFHGRFHGLKANVERYDEALARLESDNKIDTYNSALENAIKAINATLHALDDATRPGAQGQDTFSTHAPIAFMATEMVHGVADDVVNAAAEAAKLNLLLQTLTGRLTSRATQLARHSQQVGSA